MRDPESGLTRPGCAQGLGVAGGLGGGHKEPPNLPSGASSSRLRSLERPEQPRGTSRLLRCAGRSITKQVHY